MYPNYLWGNADWPTLANKIYHMLILGDSNLSFVDSSGDGSNLLFVGCFRENQTCQWLIKVELNLSSVNKEGITPTIY